MLHDRDHFEKKISYVLWTKKLCKNINFRPFSIPYLFAVRKFSQIYHIGNIVTTQPPKGCLTTHEADTQLNNPVVK